MSTITLAELLKPQTEAQLATVVLGNMASAGFPTTSWHSTSVPTCLVNGDARAMADIATMIPKVAAGGLVKLSTGDYLTLLASSNYLEERSGATYAIRNLRLVDSTGVPTVVGVGALLAQSAGGRYYRNTNAGTVPANGTLDLTWKAEGPGSAYNADAAPWTLSTPLPGVGLVSLALVTQGADAEGDASLQAKCTTKWSTLGAGGNDDAYHYHATHTPGVTEVARVKVARHTPLPGQVTLYLATATGAISTADTNSAVAQTGSGPLVTLTGTPTKDLNAIVYIVIGGAIGVALFRYSIDGGLTFTSSIVTSATYLIPGTGVTVNFAAGTYVAGTTYVWTSTVSARTKVQLYIDPPSHLGKAPTCVDVFVNSAVANVVAPVATVYRKPSYAAAILTAHQTDIPAIASDSDIGGTVYRAEFIERLMKPAGVVNVVLTTPAADITLAASEVLVITSLAGVTYVDV